MNFEIKNFRPILGLFEIGIPLFILHKFIFEFTSFKTQTVTFHHSLELLYTYFLIASCIIIFILIKVKEINLDYVGYAFLLLTSLKMLFSYFMLQPILRKTEINGNFEKFNFFFLFIIFLLIETIITAQILNKKR